MPENSHTFVPKKHYMTKNVMQRITEKLNQPEEYENI